MRSLFFTFIVFVISYCAYAQTFDIDTIQFNGSSDTLINVVILGDGYTQAQLPLFVDDAHNSSEVIFKETPFSNYQNYFNVFLIKVPSNVSGAANDPDELIDNYYGSTFNAYYDIERLLVPMRKSKITNVLAHNFPSYDQVILIVNDTRYGGSGGSTATSSTNSSSLEILLHELGHSFANLSDEYWAGDQYAYEGRNMTQETNIESLRWKNWYDEFGIGLFPHSESPSWYRPHQNCKMRYLGADFCAVCTEGIIERIHSICSPFLSHYPVETDLSPSDYPVSFNTNLIKPEPNTLQVKWVLNDSTYLSNLDSFILNEEDLNEGINNLSVAIVDTTKFLRIDNHNSVHLSTIHWSIKNAITGIDNIVVVSTKMDINIYPNPFHGQLTIRFNKKLKEYLVVEIIDMVGKTQFSKTFSPQEQYSLSTNSLNKGYYIMKLYSANTMIGSTKVVKL